MSTLRLAGAVLLAYMAAVMVIGAAETVRAAHRRAAPALPHQHVVFEGHVEQATVARTVTELQLADAQSYPFIVLEINSWGGELDAGYQLSAVIEALKTPTVCVVGNKAMSMAFYILQSCTWRLMTPGAQLMVHEPRWTTTVSGPPKTFQDALRSLQQDADRMLVHEAKRLRVGIQDLGHRIADGAEWYMGADEALAVGAVDAVVPSVRSVTSDPGFIWRR